MINDALRALLHALTVTFSMTWEILWALILGFFLAAVVQSVVSKKEVTRLMPDSRPRSLATAAALGCASSSCSYAAAAITRSLFRKGADFVAAIAFQVASTNLVIELGIILWLLLGWQFALAQYAGGFVMIALLGAGLKFVMRPRLIASAKEKADTAVAGHMEGHAAMDMTVPQSGPIMRRIFSERGWNAISENFVMEWAAVLRDIAFGLLIAGAIAAWVPQSFLQSIFFQGHHTVAKIWGPIVGPLVSVVSFVCSIGNVPLAAVLWKGGISFGGVISFIFADLIILPLLSIYRKYYGTRVAITLFFSLWFAMSLSGLAIDAIFSALGLVPAAKNAAIPMQADVRLNYTAVLNVAFLILAAMLVVQLRRSGGWSMLKMMNGEVASDDAGSCCHHGHGESGEAGVSRNDSEGAIAATAVAQDKITIRLDDASSDEAPTGDASMAPPNNPPHHHH